MAYTEVHFARDVVDDADKLGVGDLVFVVHTQEQEFGQLFLTLHTVEIHFAMSLEVRVQSSAVFGVDPLLSFVPLVREDLADRNPGQQRSDVFLRDETVSIEVVHVEHHVRRLLKVRIQHSARRRHELVVSRISVLVLVKQRKKPFPYQTRQPEVLQDGGWGYLCQCYPRYAFDGGV